MMEGLLDQSWEEFIGRITPGTLVSANMISQ